MRLAAVDGQLDLATDHQLGQVVLVRLCRDALADDTATPDHRDPVGDLEHLVQLVADEDDAVTLGGEPAQDGEDLLGLLGREDRRRLVEDEDPRLAVEGLEDLDPLLPSDRQAADLGVRVDLEAEPLDRARGSACWASRWSRKTGLAIVSSPRRMFSATVRTGTSMKCWWTMLMPRAIASDGPVIWTGSPSSRISPSSGAGEAVEDVHQGRLAGAVLAEQGVDLAGPDVEVDAVVGDHARIALRDAAHLERGRAERGRLAHLASPSRRLAIGRRIRRAGRPLGTAGPLAMSRW